MALGETVEQPLTVRLDPRVHATTDDMQMWHQQAARIERTECTLGGVTGTVAALEHELDDRDARAATESLKSAIAAFRAALHPIVLGVRGERGVPDRETAVAADASAAVFYNLPSRINWLTIQVGNYSGRPTAAQVEWIEKYATQTDALVRQLDAIKAQSLSALNTQLKAAGLPEIVIEQRGS